MRSAVIADRMIPEAGELFPFPALRLVERRPISAGATGSPHGDEKGSRVEGPRCPCNCKRRAIRPSRHWNRQGFEKAVGKHRPVSQETCLTPSFFDRTGCAGRTGASSPSDSHSLAGAAVQGEFCRLPDAGLSPPSRFPTGRMPSGWRDVI